MDTTSTTPAGAETNTPAPGATETDEAPAKPAYRSKRFDKPEPVTPKPEAGDDDAGKAAADPEKSEKKEEKKAPSGAETKVKLKVHGKEVDVDLEEEFPGIKKIWKEYDEPQRKKFLAQVQKMKAADRSLEETSITKKQATELIKTLQTDPFKVLEDPRIVGKDKLRERLEDYLYDNFVKLEAMDPKERELFEVKHKLKVFEEEKKKQEEAAKEKDLSDMTSKFQTDYQKQISEALDVAGLPKSALTVQRTAYYLKQALERGHRLKAGDVMDLVKSDFQKWFTEMYQSTDGEKLISLFGEDVAEKINKARMAKLKGGAPSSSASESSGESGESNAPRQKFKSLDEWREANRRRKQQVR